MLLGIRSSVVHKLVMYQIHKLFVLFGLCVSTIYSEQKETNHTQVNKHSVKRIPYNPRKINTKGEYQEYNGYTIIAKMNDKLNETANELELFLRNSSFAQTYSPLPATTYHTSLFTIYSCGNKMIPPIREWFNENNHTNASHNCLPDGMLTHQHDRATCVLHKYLNEPLLIVNAILDIGKRIISFHLTLENESLNRIEMVRNKLKEIYRHSNKSMEPIYNKLHITLAYVYAHQIPRDFQEKLHLLELTNKFKGSILSQPLVYRYSSMKDYSPYFTNTTDIEC